MEKHKFLSVDEYESQFPAEVQLKIGQIRKIIQETAPEAQECISYNMPAYKYKGVLVYFAAYKNHIGFYPTGSGIKHFESELGPYKWAKGSIQFPLNQEIPFDLIQKIVTYRLEENRSK
ncbi:MAG: iron chaperone [Flectobacillus sp.]|uniref:iron chaperone n=1 Tax=Flectobacillus sp. TaxID=50419 RepID=UPI003B9B9740